MADDPRPTAADVLKEPAGRRLDAWVEGYALGGEIEWYRVGGLPEPFVSDRTCGPGEPRRYRVGDHSTSWAAAGPLLGRGFAVAFIADRPDGPGWWAWRTDHDSAAVPGDDGKHALARAVLIHALEDRR